MPPAFLPDTEPEALSLGPCFSSHPVDFALLRAGGYDFVAYYGTEGDLQVASISSEGGERHFSILPERVGWDSHNGLSIARDSEGMLHLSGNMHGNPLVYFRSSLPDDVTSFERVESMVGDLESRVTYPNFFEGPEHALYFTYRDGSSGCGDQITNVYAPSRQTWQRVGNGPVVSGEGRANAYLEGPVRGPDGCFHLCWTWREHYEAHTCRDVCYARSRDLRVWEDSRGRPLDQPITAGKAEIVDAIPVGGGLLNGNIKLGFDAQNRVVISYHKFDETRRNQIWQARSTAQGWTFHQTSHWDETWAPQGTGTLIFRFRISAVRVDRHGRLCQSIRYDDGTSELWLLNQETLKMETRLRPPEQSANWPKTPGLRRRWQPEILDDPARALTWETWPENQDRPRPTLHPGSHLQLVRLRN